MRPGGPSYSGRAANHPIPVVQLWPSRAINRHSANDPVADIGRDGHPIVMDAYRNIDSIIERRVRDTGSTLFNEWAGEPSRFFHLSGDPPSECFQVVIFPPKQGSVAVQAASIDTNDGAEMLEVWQGPEGSLDTLLDTAIAQIETWKRRVQQTAK